MLRLEPATLRGLIGLVGGSSGQECEAVLQLAAALVTRLRTQICFAESPFLALSDVRLVTDHVDEDDACAAALVCTAFRVALTERSVSSATPWCSSISGNAGTVSRIAWAVGCGMPLSEKVCELAAKGGNLEVMKWARAQGCPWDHKTCESAAYGGHWEMLDWALSEGCPRDDGLYDADEDSEFDITETEPEYTDSED